MTFTAIFIYISGYIESSSYKKHMKTHEVKGDEEVNNDNGIQVVIRKDETKGENKPEENEQNEQDQVVETQIVVQAQNDGAQKRYKCGLCTKNYMYLHSLKKHMLNHVHVFNPEGTDRIYNVRVSN